MHCVRQALKINLKWPTEKMSNLTGHCFFIGALREEWPLHKFLY